MKAALRPRCPLLLVLSALALIAVGHAGAAQDPSVSNQAEMSATLYVFNDSGRTLISGKQKVQENGRTLVNLPRQTYQKVSILAGVHEFRLPNRGKPKVRLEAEAGKTYYLVVAYKPARSYTAPVGGSPFVLQEITEDEALSFMKTMVEVMTP